MYELENIIPKGKNNAIHLEVLANRLGVNQGTAKNLVRSARRNGAFILSGINGYWYAENEQEKREFVLLMKKQAISRLVSIKAINRTLNTINGQYDLISILNEATEENKDSGTEQNEIQ